MDQDSTRLTDLFQRYIDGTSTASEREALMELLASRPDLAPAFHALIRQEIDKVDKGLQPIDQELPLAELRKMLDKILREPAIKPVPAVFSMLRKRSWQVAAGVFAVVLTAVVWRSIHSLHDPSKKLTAIAAPPPKIHIRAPVGPKPILTLSDGSSLSPDSLQTGTIAAQGNTDIRKLADGGIAYRGASQGKDGMLLYNILTVPRGSQVVSLTLSDGTRVWLNAASSLRYPAAFTGRDRNVEVSGEAYFEVASNPSMPFSVSTGQTVVQVLGTHFNVNAYEHEEAIKVTLTTGSVRVRHGHSTCLLKPGQQALAAGSLTLADHIDVEAVMAWKNGFFSMQETDAGALLRQISRWYDVDLDIHTALPKKEFGGSISRDLDLPDVLKALEIYGINARLKDGKIVIEN